MSLKETDEDRKWFRGEYSAICRGLRRLPASSSLATFHFASCVGDAPGWPPRGSRAFHLPLFRNPGGTRCLGRRRGQTDLTCGPGRVSIAEVFRGRFFYHAVRRLVWEHIMARVFLLCVLSLILLGGISPARATDRSYRNITAFSPSGQYKVEAKSPDNEAEGYHPFQSHFVYKCTDTKKKAVLWTRLQAMGKPTALGGDSSAMLVLPKEASPVDLFVNNAGCTVIRTGWDELVVVGRDGKDRGKLRILDGAFSRNEIKKYVHQTTAGTMWSGLSRWYFVRYEDTDLFVLRPWWGQYVAIDLASAKVVEIDAPLRKTLVEQDRRFVLSELARGVKNRPKWEKEDCCDSLGETLTAAYLAGVLRVKEAIPLLRELEDSACSLSSTSMGWCDYKAPEGRMDPSSWETLTVRQTVHVALRRLGDVPGPYPCNRFDTAAEKYRDQRPYTPPPLAKPRAENVERLKVGMPLEEVLSLIASPDLIENQVWLYDIDAKLPYTLEVHWGKTGVTAIRRVTPPLWQTEKWDEILAH
jgi:hypothetical protein